MHFGYTTEGKQCHHWRKQPNMPPERRYTSPGRAWPQPMASPPTNSTPLLPTAEYVTSSSLTYSNWLRTHSHRRTLLNWLSSRSCPLGTHRICSKLLVGLASSLRRWSTLLEIVQESKKQS